MKWYQGKKVFITGGSKGIGRAAALQLARSGAAVVVAARGAEALDETVAAMKATGGAGPFGRVSVDVTDAAAVEAAAGEALDILGGIDVLICNAGYAWPGLVEDAPLESFEAMMRTNYLGHVHTVRAFLPRFLEQGHGHINLVSSVIGFLPVYGYAAYSASKFAIVGFAGALDLELKPRGIQVSLFYPPTTDTPGLARENEIKPPVAWAMEHDSAFAATYTAEQVADHLLRHIASGRYQATHGLPNHLIYHVNRLMPGVARWMSHDEVAKAMKKVAAGKVHAPSQGGGAK